MRSVKKLMLVGAAVCLLLPGVAVADVSYNVDTTISVSTPAGGAVTIGRTASATVLLQGPNGTWTGASGLFTVGRTDDAVPKTGKLIVDGATQTVTGGLWLAYKNTTTGEVEIKNSGSYSLNNTGSHYVGASNGATGNATITISSGTFSCTGDVYLGYEYTGGTLGKGNVNQSGGTFTVASNKQLYFGQGAAGTSSGSYTISGGSLSAGTIRMANLGQATFTVTGSTPTISCGTLWTRATKSTLKFTLDGSGVSPITATSSVLGGAGGTADKVEGIVDMAGAGTPNTYYDLIVKSGSSSVLDISTLLLASGDEVDWKLDNSVGGKVRVGYQLANLPPDANAGPDQTVKDTENTGSVTVTLDGSASSDSDGSIVSYIWSEGTDELTSGTDATASVDLAVGVHTIVLTVVDDGGASDNDTVVITVDPWNILPVANAGSDQTKYDVDADGSETVTLNGSASSDPDGTIVSYVWSEGTDELASGTDATASVLLAVGTHTITLKVTDDKSGTDDDTVVVTITPPPSSLPVYPVADSELRQQSPNSNYGTSPAVYMRLLSYGDEENMVLRFDMSAATWTINTAKLRIRVHTSYPGPSDATHHLYYMSDDSWVETDITWNNAPAELTDTGITWNIYSATDAGAWKVIDVTSLVQTELAGDKVLSLRIRPDTIYGSGYMAYYAKEQGGSDRPQLVLMTGFPPSANAGPDQTVYDLDASGTETVTLDGSASSDNGSIASYVWSEGTDELASGTDAPGTVEVDLALGTHLITLTVTDDEGETDSDDVQVTVNVLPATLELNPVADSEVRSEEPDTNYGGGGLLYIRKRAPDPEEEPPGEPSRDEGLFRFNMSTVNWPIGTAKLRLRVGIYAPPFDTIQRLWLISDDSWAEMAVTWNTAPSCTDTGITWTVYTSDGDGTWMDIDVTGLVQTELAGDKVLSVRVTCDTVYPNPPGGYMAYNAREAGGSSRPQLLLMAGIAPVADAGGDQTVKDNDNDGSETVTLDGSGSSDEDGTIVSYVWSEAGSELESGEGVPGTIELTRAVGTYVVTLTVTDNDSYTDEDRVLITVQPWNFDPVANAGPDQPDVDAGSSPSATVTLDGSGSSDADGTIVSYVWSEGEEELASGTDATASVDLAVGTHTITLTVTDDKAGTDTDDVVVTVTGSATPLDITASVDLDWVYQNTPVTTADRQHCVLTVSFLSKANETEGYDVAFTEDSGTGPGPVTNFTIQTVGGDQYNIVGGRLGSSLPYTFLDPRVYTIEVTYTGQESGQSDSASVQVKLRMLGDVEGDGDVDAQDKAQMNKRLNSLAVDYTDEEFNLTGDLDPFGDPNISAEDKAVLNRLMNSLPID